MVYLCTDQSFGRPKQSVTKNQRVVVIPWIPLIFHNMLGYIPMIIPIIPLDSLKSQLSMMKFDEESPFLPWISLKFTHFSGKMCSIKPPFSHWFSNKFSLHQFFQPASPTRYGTTLQARKQATHVQVSHTWRVKWMILWDFEASNVVYNIYIYVYIYIYWNIGFKHLLNHKNDGLVTF